MIVECSGCHTKYKIPEERIPVSGIKVRCPKCKTVFDVRREEKEEGETLAEKLFGKEVVQRPLGGEMEPQEGPVRAGVGPHVSPEAEKEPVSEERPGEVAPRPAEPIEGPVLRVPEEQVPPVEGRVSRVPKEEAPRVEGPVLRVPEEQVPPVEGRVPPPEEAVSRAAEEEVSTAEAASRLPTSDGDPRTLARALVSDILFYNREKRDRGLTEGKILAYLGKEIARSWEIYKERVGIENAIETDDFREAVNEILGEGKKVL